VHYVARGLADQRVLLLGTYRLDEARAQPRLRSLVRSLQRLGLGEEVTLTPLPSDEVAKLAAAVLAGEPPEALLRFLQDRAAGTPLYVTALIRGLRESGELFREGSTWTVGPASLSAMPAVVHDLVLGRLERLNTSERLLVEVMAVAGDAASQAVIEQVGGSGPEELDQAAGRLRELGLLVEESAGREVVFRATHPLITEVAYMPSYRRAADVGCMRTSLPPWKPPVSRIRSGWLIITAVPPGRSTPAAHWRFSRLRQRRLRKCMPTPRPPTISPLL
jgi:predicted ATPase